MPTIRTLRDQERDGMRVVFRGTTNEDDTITYSVEVTDHSEEIYRKTFLDRDKAMKEVERLEKKYLDIEPT